MEIEYELTPDDFYYFQWRAATKSKFAKRARYKAYLAVFFLFFTLFVLSGIDSEGFHLSRASFIWIAVYFPVIALIMLFFERRAIRRGILDLMKDEKPGRGQLGTHKIVLNEAGLVESTAVNQSRHSWAGVDRVEQDRDYIFIYTQAHAAHIIPKRAFNSVHEAESFYLLATAFKQTANLAS